MTNIDIEAWALRIIDQVSRDEHAEDARVELKSQWPDPQLAARQIAGHANAARGASILWIIGVDEKTGVVGAPHVELANWFAAVKSHFDGAVPSVYDINVPVQGRTVVALLFASDRAPFVVKNPMFGKPHGGAVAFEVPWREGRKTGTARRENLIRLLAPLSSLPDIEWLECSVYVENRTNENEEQVTDWHLYGHFYISPTTSAPVVIPFHRTRVAAEAANSVSLGPWDRLRVRPQQRLQLASEIRVVNDSATTVATSDEVSVRGPGKLRFETSGTFPIDRVAIDGSLKVSIELRIVGGTHPIFATFVLLPVTANLHRSQRAEWEFRPVDEIIDDNSA